MRKRKRAESPQPTEPQISEEWVEEDKLELWEIKFIGEKMEKAKLMTATRSATQQKQHNATDTPNGPTSTNGVFSKNAQPVSKTSDEVKEKLEQQLKVQRVAVNQHKKPSLEIPKSSPHGKRVVFITKSVCNILFS